MKLNAEQVFYGRGNRGYDILGASSGGQPFASRVESLCGSVGTPGGDYGGEPFLLSVPDGDSVVMICGQRGAPDGMGRSTLFFHALVAPRADLAAADADAFSLFEQGAFADKVPQGDVGALCVDARARSTAAGSPMALPAVCRSRTPSLDLVRGALGGRALDCKWATFAFQALPDFDLQVLPPRVQGIRTANEYDESGSLVRSAAAASVPQRRDDDTGGRTSPPRFSPAPSSPVPRAPVAEKSNGVLKLSIAVNIGLVVLCALLLVSRKSSTGSTSTRTEQIVVTNIVEKVVEKQVALQPSDEQKSTMEKAALERLREKFPGESRAAFLEFGKTASDLLGKYYGPAYDGETEENRAAFKDAHEFLDKLRRGIDFVNENLLKGKTP